MIRYITQRFRNRPDSEHEMRLNGIVFAIAILIYVLVTGQYNQSAIIVLAAYIVLNFAILGHIAMHPGVCHPRRIAAILGDFGAMFYEMHIGGEASTILFPIYLWVIFGNGFRFGIGFLAIATAFGLASFGAVVATTSFWREHGALSAGLLGGMVLLPLYAAVLIRKLSKAKQQAEEASQAKSLFLASVSHELRTPLTAIIGMGSVLHDTRLDPSQREMTQTVVSAGQQLLTLINDILDFSRIEAGQMTVQAADFDLPSLLSEMRAMVQTQAQSKGLHLAVHIDRRVPLRLRGSERHLREIVLNLLGNAVKFTETGGVTVAVRPETGAGERPRLRFEVSDTGIGIAPEASGHIFESFRQADASIMDRFGGTGLGLAICKRLVTLLGGEIGVDSSPGVGSTFWFTLDFDHAADTETEPAFEPIPELGLAAADAALIGRLMPLLTPVAGTIETFGSIDAALAWPNLRSADAAAVLIVDRRALPGDPQRRAQALASLRSAPAVRSILLDGPAADEPLPRELKEVFATTLSADADSQAVETVLRIAQAGRPSGRQEATAIRRRSGPVRSLSILVADDNRMNQKVLREMLTRAGHQVELAANGEEALDALDARTFDVVLMDINMPVMNGIEATKLHRFTALGRPRVPIIALTADATSGVAARCAEAGMDACLTKPIEPESLFAAIEGLLSGQTALAEPPPALPDNVTALPQVAGPAAVDMRVLDRLEALGGNDFLIELIDDFLADIATIAEDLRIAAQKGDALLFRAHAHALRSATANIGARGLSDLCQDWQGISGPDLARQGPSYMRQLTAELNRVRPILLRRRNAAARPAQNG
ncbi:hybrid sensor histidine kinase/response regulator [Inquilinus limosus]|uniref:hybrid sensor histidine kinase/response regulator n=1 Tax=Inquilinus limosus TaxID=171674 RepID=UPI0004027669|nr:hybrid sensor histidine kinase/response regulator [Inquilinus limosus]